MVVQHLELLWTVSLRIEVAKVRTHPFLAVVPYPEGHCYQETPQRMEAVHKVELVGGLSVSRVAHEVGAVRKTASALEITLIIIHCCML